MKLATCGGIDYGAGTPANRGLKARYGIVNLNSLDPEVVSDIMYGPHSTDIDWYEFVSEVKARTVQGYDEWIGGGRDSGLADDLRDNLGDFISDRVIDALAEDIAGGCDSGEITHGNRVEAIGKCVEAADLSDGYEHGGDCHRVHFDDGKLNLHTTSGGDLFVFKSPFITWAQFCSPCVPGAGSLDTPCVEGAGAKCYCLPHDWWPDGKCPYPYWNVNTGEKVFTPSETTED